MTVTPIPKGYHTITPYLTVANAAGLIEFLKAAFAAEAVAVSALPDRTVLNAELRIGNSMLMVAEARQANPNPSMFYLYVDDCDAWYERAVKAGAKSITPPTEMYYGDRSAGVENPNGNQRWMATREENVSPEEVVRRAIAAGRG